MTESDVSHACGMRYLRFICEITKCGKLRNERIREIMGVQMRPGERTEHATLLDAGP